MIQFWYKLVKAGEKTLSQVPGKYRSAVKELMVQYWYGLVVAEVNTIDDVPDDYKDGVLELFN